MSIKSKREYIEKARQDYQRATKRQKGYILDHFCAVTKLTRKHAIRALSKGYTAPREKAGRPLIYDQATLLPHVKRLWFAMDQIGAKKLAAALPHWLPHYREPDVTAEIVSALSKISASTLERYLRVIRFQTRPFGRSTTRSGHFAKNRIPIRIHDWNRKEPGHFEADTVAHCGDNINGEYAHSITATDIATTWTENRATFTKASGGVLEQLKDIEARLPFAIQSFDFDNGSEFLNYPVLEFLEKREKPIAVTRSRPYRKNDQCYVEQKNYTHVRELFGYDRVPRRDLVLLMNEIYRDYWSPFQNFFIPTMKLTRKTRIGAKIKKEYEKPQTPYDRVMKSPFLSDEQKVKLKARYESLDPFVLKAEMEKKLKAYFVLLRKRELSLLPAA
jgi:hypothetical protein